VDAIWQGGALWEYGTHAPDFLRPLSVHGGVVLYGNSQATKLSSQQARLKEMVAGLQAEQLALAAAKDSVGVEATPAPCPLFHPLQHLPPAACARPRHPNVHTLQEPFSPRRLACD
jgi:hypothetical protein